MRQINAEVLRKGDIILTTSPAFVSKAIRFGLKSDISHAMLYVAHQSVMDSTGDGVQARNIQRMFYPDDCAIYVLRLKDTVPEATIDAVISYVRSNTGTPYSTTEAVRSVTSQRRSGSDKQFCSRLVARGYASAGILLSPNPDFCSPEDIKSSELLTHVDDPWLWINDEEAARRAAGDSTEKMRVVTKDFLDRVRVFAPRVLSLSDADSLALQRPELDRRIAEAYIESGYLDHWEMQLQLFPWRYDLDEMVTFERAISDPEGIREYCESTLRDEENGDFDHWRKNLKQVDMICRQTGSETFGALRVLYVNLVSSHDSRVAVAKAWLAMNDDGL